VAVAAEVVKLASDGDESKPEQWEDELRSSGGSGANIISSELPPDPVWRMFGGMALSRICCLRCGQGLSKYCVCLTHRCVDARHVINRISNPMFCSQASPCDEARAVSI
jgi:hypothetical protein